MESNKESQGQGGYAASQWNNLHHIASGSSSGIPIDILNFQQQQKQMIPPRHHPIHQATTRMAQQQQQQQQESLLLTHMYNQEYGLQGLPDFTSRVHTSGQQSFDYLHNSAGRAVYQAYNTAADCSGPQHFQVDNDAAALHGLVKDQGEAAGFPRMLLSKLETSSTSEGIKSKPKPTRSFTKVLKLGSIGRSLDVTRFSNYTDLRSELARMFGLEGQLDQSSGWQLVFMDNEGDILLVGDDPWEVFVNSVRGIRILSPAEVAVYTSSEDFAGTPLSACLSTRR